MLCNTGSCLNKRLFKYIDYSVGELEALAVITGVKYFHHYLVGRRFTIYTDNTSVSWLLSLKEPTGRLARWLMTLQSYDFELVYKPGRTHGNADAVSRIVNLRPVVASAEMEDQSMKGMRESQRNDAALLPIIQYLEEATPMGNLMRGKLSQKAVENFFLDGDHFVMAGGEKRETL